MSDEIERDTLRRELDEIKQAMGLYDRYPGLARRWLVEGIGIGILGPLVQLTNTSEPVGYRPLLIGAAFLLVFAAGMWAHYSWVPAGTPEGASPARTPHFQQWENAVIAGIIALTVGLWPVIQQQPDGATNVVLLVGVPLGMGYIFMGQMLRLSGIRAADYRAFYSSGLWLLLLVAVIPNVPLLRQWTFTIVGLGLALHHIGAYFVLSRD